MVNTNDFVMNKDIYETVTNAIVEQAATDYIRCKKRKYKLNTYIYKYKGERILGERRLKLIRECDRMINDVLRFFKGEWYSAICKIDSKYLLDRLDEVYEEELVDTILRSAR